MNLANFTLARTSLIRLGCPRELEGQLANRALGRPIVAVANKYEYGKTASDYCPPAVVVCGAETRRQLLAQGHTKSWAFLERGAVDVDANDAMPYDELMARLSTSLQDKYYGGLPGQARPSITRIYPFENRVEFRLRDQQMAHQYALDPVGRTPLMLGNALRCSEDTTTYSPESKQFMPKAQTGLQYIPGWTPGNSQSTTQGANRSELVTNIIRNVGDVQRAVAQYLAVVHGARSIRPSFQPVAVTYDKKINAMLQAKGVDAFEFALWVAAKERGEFAYPAEKKLPLNTPGRVRNALARVNQVKGIPADKKPGVLEKIRRKAKHIGVDVSEPTPGQKKWAKKKVAATVEYTDYPRQGGKGSGPGYPTGQMASAACPHCGAKMVGDLNACPKCGKKINAGGPGSGRHPGAVGHFGRAVADSYGYEVQKEAGDNIVFHHPLEGDTVHYSKSLGRWHHRDKSGNTIKKGIAPETLDTHLGKYNSR